MTNSEGQILFMFGDWGLAEILKQISAVLDVLLRRMPSEIQWTKLVDSSKPPYC